MVKLRGPLMSLDAHGSVSKIITYSRRKSGAQVRSYNKPGRVPSYAQRGQRRLTEFIVAQWQSLSDADKAGWEANARAAGSSLPGYHYFLKRAQRDLLGVHGLRAYWPCNRIISSEFPDISGGSHNLILEPTPPTDCPTLADSMSKRFGRTGVYDGVNEYARVATDLLPSGEDWSVEVWLRCRGELAGGTDKYATVWGSATWVSGVKGVCVRKTSSGHLACVWGTGVAGWQERTILENIATVNANKWIHLVITYDTANTTMRYYADSVLKEARVYSYASSEGEFRLGHSYNLNGAEAFWYGDVDEVCIYNRKFGAAEILRRYRFGVGST